MIRRLDTLMAGARRLAPVCARVARAAVPAGVAAVTCVVATSPLAAQETPSEGEMARLAQMVTEAMAPGPAHERLAELAGRWIVETRLWLGPGADATVLAGTAESRTVLDGRFLAIESLVGEGASAIRSLSLAGFDRRWREYTIHLCDTWGTYCVDARGPGSGEGGEIVMSGTERDPLLRHTQVYDVVLRIVDADTWSTTIYFHDPAHMRGGDEPFKAMETIYTRMP